jgi:hypothetical protein
MGAVGAGAALSFRETLARRAHPHHRAGQARAPDKPQVREESHLTLVFQRRDGKWVMVLDQNTPLR